MTKILLSGKIKSYWITSDSYYSMQSFEKFTKYFFSFIIKDNKLKENKMDVNIFDIQETDIPKNKLNILLCVENCPYWTHYKHYNKYGNYGDENIKIYLYNHIDKCIFDEKFISIPVIYLQLDHFKKFYCDIKPTKLIPFHQKKFCLIATTINNSHKQQIVNFLNQIEKCDYITNYKTKLNNKSCYHSLELMNVFNNYKFVFVSENSINDGYITEKIFNCYFSRTIPIYYGSKKIDYYFNNSSFINMNDGNFDKNKQLINEFMNDEEKYNNVINTQIINDWDDEDYIQKIQQYLN